MSEARQRVMETNRSLRLIKTELENLLEKGVIDDAAFDSIHALLPAEASLSNPAARSNNPTPAPSTSLPTPASAPAPSTSPAPPPRNNNNNNTTANPHPAPPSYAQSTASPPSLPARNNPAAAPPAAAAPEKPVLTHARALYRYTASDARDCSFERDDRLAVYEYMNADWWMGRNVRTGQEGIFPRSYVVAVAAAAGDGAGGEKAGALPQLGYQQQQGYQPQYQQQQQQYPMAPVPVHGYPAAPPPGQPAVPYGQAPPQQQPQEGGEGGRKMGEHGKKFGKKLGNAAIFGAGATIGSNIVNSIF